MEDNMKSIRFNTDMVRALMDGRKTCTRRVLKGYALEHLEIDVDGSIIGVYDQHEGCVRPVMDFAPYHPGDILYVRETWCDPSGTGYPIMYKADMPMHWDAEDTEIGIPIDLCAEDYKWCPSIHMPREAARIFLRVTDIRAEKLQDITEDGVCEEGAEPLIAIECEHPIYYPEGGIEMCWNTECCRYCPALEESYAKTFGRLVWNPTIKKTELDKYGWDANPWVWVIEFERCGKPEEIDV